MNLNYLSSANPFKGEYDVYEPGFRKLREAYDHDIELFGHKNTLRLYDSSLDYRSAFETYPIELGSFAGELVISSALEAALCRSHRTECFTSSLATGLVSGLISAMPGAMIGFVTEGECPEVELMADTFVGAMIAFSLGGLIGGLMALGSALIRYMLKKKSRY